MLRIAAIACGVIVMLFTSDLEITLKQWFRSIAPIFVPLLPAMLRVP